MPYLLPDVAPSLHSLGCRFTLTGSTLICPEEAKDQDWLVEVPAGKMAEVEKLLALHEFEDLSSEEGVNSGAAPDGTHRHTRRWARGNNDLILTEHADFAEKFRLAGRVCANLKLCRRTDRIMVFHAILYGKFPADPPEPTDDQIYNGPGIEGGVRYPMAYHDYI